MKSTRWIAVAFGLMTSPLFAVAANDGLEFKPTESEANAAAEAQRFEAERSDAQRAETQLTVPLSFDAELEQLRKDIATTKELREKAANEAGQPLSSDAVAAQEQRRVLLELLTKLATKNVSSKNSWEPPPLPTAPPPAPKTNESPSETSNGETKPNAPVVHPLITEKIVDPYALGRALFRSGDYVGSEQAFRKVKATDENRVLLQYLVATCLRKQSKLDQAAKAYRKVAEQKDDPTLRDLAIWQLDNIRWNQKTGEQLEELRQLRQPLETQKSSSAIGTNDASSR